MVLQMGVLNAVRKVVGGADPVTALWVTHRLEELDYADGAIYMENGRVVLSGTVEDVKWYIQKQQDQMHNNGGFR
jgi:ABC-type multidrug transport system ATPase subunit